MADLSDQSAQHLASTANRLRAVQIDFAGRDVDVRRVYLAEELRHALAAVEPPQRHEFLEHLATHFPGDDAADGAPPAEGSTLWQQPVGRQPLSPEAAALAAKLIEVCARSAASEQPLPEPQAQTAPGGAEGASGPVPMFDPSAVRSFCATLELPTAEDPDPNRLLALAETLIEFVLPVYQLTWTTWRTLAPNSAIRRTGNLQRTLTHFIAGEEGSADALASELNRLRQMAASLVSALGHVGQQVTAGYLSRFQPGEIEQIVSAESGGGGLFKSQAARCWRKYQELAAMLESAALDTEVRRAIATHVEQLMKGTNAGSSRTAGDSGP
jgi:hypothetical protein